MIDRISDGRGIFHFFFGISRDYMLYCASVNL
jgi:hypothetical protein